MTLEKAKERRRKIQKNMLKTAKAYATYIKKKLGKATIVLYGSVVRGDFGKLSDIDVLVISDKLKRNFLDRFDVLLSQKYASVEPKGYTRKEFLSLRKTKSFEYMLAKKNILKDDLLLFP